MDFGAELVIFAKLIMPDDAGPFLSHTFTVNSLPLFMPQ
jgi:hypothetical protein